MNMTAFPLEELPVIAFIFGEVQAANKRKRRWMHGVWKK
jgi:hypothetical protein